MTFEYKKHYNIFFDTEFYENGKTIEPISIGLIKEDGEQLYLVNKDFDYDAMMQWLKTVKGAVLWKQKNF